MKLATTRSHIVLGVLKTDSFWVGWFLGVGAFAMLSLTWLEGSLVVVLFCLGELMNDWPPLRNFPAWKEEPKLSPTLLRRMLLRAAIVAGE